MCTIRAIGRLHTRGGESPTALCGPGDPRSKKGFPSRSGYEREIRVLEQSSRVPKQSRDSSPREASLPSPHERESRACETRAGLRFSPTRLTPSCGRIRRKGREVAPHVARHGSQEVPHRGSYDESPPATPGQRLGPLRGDRHRPRSPRSDRHEIGSPAVISPKIAKELASWPFCLQFSEKARWEIRNRDDMA